MKKILSLLALIAVSTIGFFANAQTAYVKAYALNLRSWPTNTSHILRTLSKWESVTVLDSSWGRRLVSTSDWLEGYVYSIFLSKEFISPTKIVTTNAVQYKITEFRANVRTIGNILRPIAILWQGDIVKVIDNKLYLNHRIKVKVITSSTLWYYVGRIGYISKNVVEQIWADVSVPYVDDIEEKVEEVIEEEVIEEEEDEEIIIKEEEDKNQVSEEEANSENSSDDSEDEEDIDIDDFDLESLFQDL